MALSVSVPVSTLSGLIFYVSFSSCHPPTTLLTPSFFSSLSISASSAALVSTNVFALVSLRSTCCCFCATASYSHTFMCKTEEYVKVRVRYFREPRCRTHAAACKDTCISRSSCSRASRSCTMCESRKDRISAVCFCRCFSCSVHRISARRSWASSALALLPCNKCQLLGAHSKQHMHMHVKRRANVLTLACFCISLSMILHRFLCEHGQLQACFPFPPLPTLQACACACVQSRVRQGMKTCWHARAYVSRLASKSMPWYLCCLRSHLMLALCYLLAQARPTCSCSVRS